MKKVILTLIPIAIFIFALASFIQFTKPVVSEFVVNQLARISKDKLPVQIEAERFDYSLLPPAVTLSNVKVLSSDPGLGFQSLQIDSIELLPDLLQLLGGRLVLGNIVIDRANIDVDLDKIRSSGNNAKIDLEPLFQALRKIPLFKISVRDALLHFSSKKQNTRVTAWGLNADIYNQSDSLSIRAESKNIETHLNHMATNLRLSLSANLSPKNLEIKQVQISGYDSFIRLNGNLENLSQLFQAPTGKLQAEARLKFASLNFIETQFPNFPKITGELELKAGIGLDHGNLGSGSIAIKGNELFIGKYELGNPNIAGQLSQRILTFNRFQIDQSSLNLVIDKASLDFSNLDSISFNAEPSTDFFDLNQFLISIDVGQIPVEVLAGARFKCQGILNPSLKIDCTGRVDSDFVEARGENENPKKRILLLEDFSAQGDVTVTSDAVTYKGKLIVEKDEIESQGRIGYEDGFQISYNTDQFDLAKINYLNGFDLEGRGKFSGQTQGNSKTCTFFIDFDTADLAFEDYVLGQASGRFRYEKSILYFDDVSGALGDSRYSTQFSIDLKDSTLDLRGQMSKMEIPDVLTALQRKVNFPVEFTGNGKAQFTAQGPLDLSQLSYRIQTQVNQGSLAGESYQNLLIDISALKGEAKIEKAQVQKGDALIEATGAARPNGDIDLFVIGRGINIDESENIARLQAGISGQLDFTLAGKGFILDPDFQLKAQIANMSIEEQDYPDSSFAVEFNKQRLQGTAALFGNRLTGEFIIPYDNKGAFKLKAQAFEWNFTTIFPLLGSGNLFTDYQAELTGVVDIEAAQGGIFNSSGRLNIQQFGLRRANLNLSNRTNMEAIFSNGHVTLKNFQVAGEAGFIDVSGDNFTKENLRIKVSSQLQMRLMQIFFPFLEEVAGQAALSISVAGDLFKPEILGTASVADGLLRIKNLPHPFERVQGSAQFSHSKIIINQVSSQFAGGNLTADGYLLIEGVRNVPTFIKARAENISLNIPEQFRTSGNADLQLTGSWFPFTLAGTYTVNSGLIDREFTEFMDVENKIKPSSYLPKKILQASFDPLRFDLLVELSKGILVKNSNADATLRGSVQVKGTPTQPILLGKLSIDKSSYITFRENKFEVVTGSLNFTDPIEINPEVYLVARTRLKEYDITVLFQGTAKNPVVKMSSTPNLAEADIVSLLAIGMTSSTADKSLNAREAEANSGFQVGTAIITANPLAKDIQEKLGVNVNFSSGYDDTRNATVQRFTIGKKLTNKLSVSASRVRGTQSSTEFKAEYSFNPNVSAIATFENREQDEVSQYEGQSRGESILGLDLQFRREFR